MTSKDPKEFELRCPRLGGTVPFAYCMAPGEPNPCPKILDCWWEVFDVASYLKAHLSEEDFCRVLEERKPPSRMNTILDLVEKFKNTDNGENRGSGQEDS